MHLHRIAACAGRHETGASHALAVLIEVDDGPDRIDFGGSIHLAIAAEDGVESRARASMVAATGCASVQSRPSSTACAATSRASRLQKGRISSGCDAERASNSRRTGKNLRFLKRSGWSIASILLIGSLIENLYHND